MTWIMLAVSNTSPISNLAIIGRLDLLRLEFRLLWIPTAVLVELKAHPRPQALAAIEAAVADQWIRVASPRNSPLHRMLSAQLHRGEAEAIALAAEMKADVVLIDEQEGREAALETGLSIMGVLGILLKAKRSGRITALKPEIQALRAEARFFVSPALEAKVLSSAGE